MSAVSPSRISNYSDESPFQHRDDIGPQMMAAPPPVPTIGDLSAAIGAVRRRGKELTLRRVTQEFLDSELKCSYEETAKGQREEVVAVTARHDSIIEHQTRLCSLLSDLMDLKFKLGSLPVGLAHVEEDHHHAAAAANAQSLNSDLPTVVSSERAILLELFPKRIDRLSSASTAGDGQSWPSQAATINDYKQKLESLPTVITVPVELSFFNDLSFVPNVRQDARDLLRDTIKINGTSIPGHFGFDLIIRLVAHSLKNPALFGQSSDGHHSNVKKGHAPSHSNLESLVNAYNDKNNRSADEDGEDSEMDNQYYLAAALVVIHLANRTLAGGVGLEEVMKIVGHPDFGLIVPRSMEAMPLEILTDTMTGPCTTGAPFRSSEGITPEHVSATATGELGKEIYSSTTTRSADPVVNEGKRRSGAVVAIRTHFRYAVNVVDAEDLVRLSKTTTDKRRPTKPGAESSSSQLGKSTLSGVVLLDVFFNAVVWPFRLQSEILNAFLAAYSDTMESQSAPPTSVLADRTIGGTQPNKRCQQHSRNLEDLGRMNVENSDGGAIDLPVSCFVEVSKVG